MNQSSRDPRDEATRPPHPEPHLPDQDPVLWKPRTSRWLLGLAALATLVAGALLAGTYFIDSDIARAFSMGLFFAALIAALVLFVLAHVIGILDRLRVQMVEKLEQRVQARTETLRQEVERHDRLTHALRASEERFRDFAETSAHWFWEMGPDLRFTYVSEHVSRFTGIARSAIIGRTREEVFAGQPVPAEAWEEHLANLAAHRPFENLEVQWVRPDGAVRYLRNSGKPLLDADGTFLGYRGTARDVTQQRLAEMELVRATREAEAASSVKSQFLANMSHEMRTPLNGVLGMTELLLNTDLDARQRHLADAARRSGELLLNIIRDILDLSRVEAGKLVLDQHELSVRDVIEETARQIAPDAYAKGLELVVSVDDDVPDGLHGDAVRLSQVLTNLLFNAVKFTERGEVVASCAVAERKPDHVLLRFTVRDTGVGIEPGLRDRIFDSFEQGDSSSTRRHGGAGLGLAISRQLTHLMGGNINVQSERHRGSTFWFTVRLETGDTVREAPAMDPRLKGHRVLLAQGNASGRRQMRATLRGAGLVVDAFADAASVLDRLTESGECPYDIAVVDSGLHTKAGHPLHETLRAKAPCRSLPVVLLTTTAPENPIPAGVRGVEKPPRRLALEQALVQLLPSAGTVPVSERSADGEPLRPRYDARVLIVEDNPVNAEATEGMLQILGCRTYIANNGREALDACADNVFDLILMDCEMPEMDGFEATRRLRRGEARCYAERPAPIVALTAHAMEGDQERFLGAGMDDYLSKPVSLKRLHGLLRRWTSERSRGSGGEPGAAAPRSAATPS